MFSSANHSLLTRSLPQHCCSATISLHPSHTPALSSLQDMTSMVQHGRAQLRSQSADKMYQHEVNHLGGLVMRSGASPQMQASSDSNSGSEDDSPADIQSAPHKSEQSQVNQYDASTQDDPDSRYVKLDSEYLKTLTWSNDPRDLDLYGAFSPEAPNLSSDFNVEGLRPILKEEDGYDPWILRDAKGLYYLWDAWGGRLHRVTDYWTKGPNLTSTEAIVDRIVCSLSFVEDEAVQVFRTYD